MFTKTEKGYLALTLILLATGSGIKAYRHASVRLGPFPDPAFAVKSGDGPDSADSPASAPGPSEASGPPLAVNDSSRGEAVSAPMSSGPGSGAVSGTHPDRPRAVAGPAAHGAKPSFAGKVDINRAEAAELTGVPGIGEKTAQALIRHRKSHGPFKTLRDVLQVKGIGEKKLEKLEAYLIL